MHPTLTNTSAFERLARAYGERLESTRDTLGGMIAAIEESGPQDAQVEELKVIAHGMAGTGTTFGHPEVTAAGRRLDEYLFRGGRAPAELLELARALHAAIVSALEGVQ